MSPKNPPLRSNDLSTIPAGASVLQRSRTWPRGRRGCGQPGESRGDGQPRALAILVRAAVRVGRAAGARAVRRVAAIRRPAMGRSLASAPGRALQHDGGGGAAHRPADIRGSSRQRRATRPLPGTQRRPRGRRWLVRYRVQRLQPGQCRVSRVSVRAAAADRRALAGRARRRRRGAGGPRRVRWGRPGRPHVLRRLRRADGGGDLSARAPRLGHPRGPPGGGVLRDRRAADPGRALLDRGHERDAVRHRRTRVPGQARAIRAQGGRPRLRRSPRLRSRLQDQHRAADLAAAAGRVLGAGARRRLARKPDPTAGAARARTGAGRRQHARLLPSGLALCVRRPGLERCVACGAILRTNPGGPAARGRRRRLPAELAMARTHPLGRPGARSPDLGARPAARRRRGVRRRRRRPAAAARHHRGPQPLARLAVGRRLLCLDGAAMGRQHALLPAALSRAVRARGGLAGPVVAAPAFRVPSPHRRHPSLASRACDRNGAGRHDALGAGLPSHPRHAAPVCRRHPLDAAPRRGPGFGPHRSGRRYRAARQLAGDRAAG